MRKLGIFLAFPLSETCVTDFCSALSSTRVDISSLCEHGDLALSFRY